MAKKNNKPIRKPQSKIKSPKRELDSVRKEIRKAKQPLYSINRKIKNAPSKYYERKYKKERKDFLQNAESRLSELSTRRRDLSKQYKEYGVNQVERDSLKRRVRSIEKKIAAAVDDQDLSKVEHLRYQLLKGLGELDKLSEKMGIELEKTNISKFNREEQDGGAGYEIDIKSPYAIWEAIKQLHLDLDGENFKYFVVNGKRYSSDSIIQITAEASDFWIASKKGTGGTPYVNRYVNFKTKSVKYLHFNS